MQNILLRHCRETSRLTEKLLTTRAGLTLQRYHVLEAAEALMTVTESKALGKVFNIDPSYLWQSSAQLEQLITARELVHLQQKRIDTLTIS
jgi:hypothetical protein